MKCRSCGLEIADKAIVCYRCGAPTADLPAPVAADRRRRPNWTALPVMLVIIALAVWLIPKTPPGSVERWEAWFGLVVITVTSAVWLRRRRRA
jgi:hypothetical protein